jgi:iron complex transport system substrate-binding protein
LAAKPSRIVSLSPAVTEMILALGGESAVVGVTRYCIVPERQPPVARVGGVLDPDYERITSLHPDLVLVPYLANRELPDKLEGLGLTVVVLNPEGLDYLPKDFRLAGRAIGHVDKGEQLAGQFEQLRALVKRRLQAVPKEQKPTAVMLYGDTLLAPTAEGFAGQLLAEGGATNVVQTNGRAWVELSAEGLLKLNPQMIFLVRDSTKVVWPPADQPALQGLSAVQKGKVVDLPESLFIRPGALQGTALWAMARALHPALFPEANADEAMQAASK